MLVRSENDLADAISRGAPPFERLQSPTFRSLYGAQKQGEAIAKQWIDNIFGSYRQDEHSLMRACGLDNSHLAKAFGAARLDQNAVLPEWAANVVMLLRMLPDSLPNYRSDAEPTILLAEGLLGPASAFLNWDGLCESYSFLTPGVLCSLTAHLATRILIASWSIFELENAQQERPVWDFGSRAWRERVCLFPGLTYVLGTAIRQWKQTGLEIIFRVEEDFAVLSQLNGSLSSNPKLASIECDRGDRHNDGRSVAVLVFDNDQRIVYKPKGLRCSRDFLNFTRALPSGRHGATFLSRRLISRGDYAWEEYIIQKRPSSPHETELLFGNFGKYLRLLQLVEGRDFWIDNLLITGNQPVFIDLECILQPRLRVPLRHGSHGVDEETYEESVLPTSAVSSAINVPGVGLQEFGALSPPGARLLPLGHFVGYENRSNDDFELKDEQIYWSPPVLWPIEGGEYVDPANYLNALERGYREMQGELCERLRHYSQNDKQIEDLANAPVRAIMRSTWEYLVLLRASLEPTALLDGNARELVLANAGRRCPTWFDIDRMDARLTVVLSEVAALRQLDIPQFTSIPTSSSLFLPGGSEVEDVFRDCAASRLRARVECISAFPTETHFSILRSAVASMSRGAHTASKDIP